MNIQLGMGLAFVVLMMATAYVALKTSTGTPLRSNPEKGAFSPKDVFARKCVRAMKERGYDQAYYDAFSFSVRTGDGKSQLLKEPWKKVGDKLGDEMDPIVDAWLETWARPSPEKMKDAFVAAMLEGLNVAEMEATYDEASFVVNFANGMNFDLKPAFDSYCRADTDEQRAQHIMRYVAGAVVSGKPIDSWEDVVDRVLPRVIHETYIGSALLAAGTAAAIAGTEAPQYPCASVGDGLALEVVIDEQVALRPLAARLTEWGIDLQTALDHAFKNFMTGEVPLRQFEDGLLGTGWDNHMEPNVLLLPDAFWGQLPVQGTPVVWALSATTTLIGGSDDPDLCSKFMRAAVQIIEHERRVAPFPVIRVDEGRWLRWRPQPKAPDATELSELVSAMVAVDFNSQRAGIKAYAEAKGWEPQFISVVTPAAHDDGAINYVVWPPLATILPPADRVMVVTEDHQGTFVDWDVFVAVAGEILKAVPGLLPMRYQFDGPCSQELRAKLLEAGGESLGNIEPPWSKD